MVRSIPRTSGRSIPGTPRVRTGGGTGGFPTNIGHQSTSGQFASLHRRQIRDTKGRFASGFGVAWIGLAASADRIYDKRDLTLAKIQENAATLAEEIRNHMQVTAPWDDRTGDARRGLQAVVVHETPVKFSIWLGYDKDVYYGIWLEVRFGGRFAIVVPTAELYGPQLQARLVAGV